MTDLVAVLSGGIVRDASLSRFKKKKSVLRDSYERGFNWESQSTQIRRASPFWQGLGKISFWVHEFLIVRLGDGSEV